MLTTSYNCDGCELPGTPRLINGRQCGPVGWLKNKENSLHVCSVECAEKAHPLRMTWYRERNADGSHETLIKYAAVISWMQQTGPDSFDRDTRVKQLTEDTTIGEILDWQKRNMRWKTKDDYDEGKIAEVLITRLETGGG